MYITIKNEDRRTPSTTEAVRIIREAGNGSVEAGMAKIKAIYLAAEDETWLNRWYCEANAYNFLYTHPTLLNTIIDMERNS